MKQKLLSGILALAFAVAVVPTAFSQPDTYYQNVGSVICPPDIPPTIDATNFINEGQFIVNITNFPSVLPSQGPVDPYETFDTLNFTNGFGAFLACNSGFLFQYNPQVGAPSPAASFYNAGTINCGTSDMTNLSYLTLRGFSIVTNQFPANFELTATNIINPGTVNMGPLSRLRFTGDSLDLTRGTLAIQNTSTNTVFGQLAYSGGIFDGYWGVGTNLINPATNFSVIPPRTFPHTVTNRAYKVFNQILTASNAAVFFQQDITFGGSNIFNRIVFLANTNRDFGNSVFFPASFGFPAFSEPDARPDIVLQMASFLTNGDETVSTNYIYLSDSYATDLADQFRPLAPLWPWLAPAGSGQTFVPINFLPFNPTYQVNQNFFFFLGLNAYAFFTSPTAIDFGPPVAPWSGPLPANLFFNVPSVANYAAYEGLFSPGTVVVGDIAGQNITNLPGRIDLTANKMLNLTRAQITSVNTLNLKATNHFVGSEGARLTTPFADINLRSTNGMMNITNLIEPTIPHPFGTCDLCSIRWTNLLQIAPSVFITNGYHVLFVNSQLAPKTSPLIQTLTLRSTNTVTHDDSIVIHDYLTVTTNLLLDTYRLTIATNNPGAETPVGGINLNSVNILWSSATPRLRYLTNFGTILAANAVFFGGSRTSPYYTSNYNEPYTVFVNRGGITNFSSQIWATDFANSGFFSASSGAIQLQQSRNAVLTNGAFFAPGNLISISCSSLLVSNHVLQAGGALTLSVANSLDDGSLFTSADLVTNKNIWNAGNGINLPILPSQASLLATTITNTASPSLNTMNQWAGLDYGLRSDGFVNNAALGRLILDGKTTASLFTFLRSGVTNALYVDLLEFKNAATNFVSGCLPGTLDALGVSLDTNFTIYYGQAIVDGQSIAEKLNGSFGATDINGGRFRWVSNYNTGFWSSTNVVYSDGTTNRLNAALVASCDIDSNGNGVPNCLDTNPIPVLTPASLVLTVAVTNVPPRTAVLSWNTLPLSSNYLYSETSLLPGTNWQLVTNFLSDATIGGRVTMTYPITNNGALYYRVRVQSP
jgi:hypothetical protein